MHPAFLYLPGARLAASELSAARLDGHLVEVGEGYIPADLLDDASTRAHSIATLIQRGTAASGPSAAWIHGAGYLPPTPHHVRRAVEHRIRLTLSARIVLHDTPVPVDDLVVVGGISVTTPVRTMTDLALGLHRDESLMRWMVLLADALPSVTAPAVAALESMSRVPGTRAGKAALQRLALRTR